MKQNLPFVFLTLAVFVFLLLPSVFREGMFMDGLIYAAISKNLANGIGTFWVPHFTQTFLPEFHEHPPLAFGFQSILFSISGKNFHVEKIYSFLTAATQVILIILIWQSVVKEKGNRNLEWLPVLLWITIPLSFWSYKNNMLENTMAVFTSGAILFQILAFRQIKVNYFYIVLSGIFIFFGFLSKGFPAFSPLVFPAIHWIVMKKISLHKYILSIIVLIGTILVFTGFLFLIPQATESLSIYLNTQVSQSLKGERVVMERYYILKKLLMELLSGLILALIFYMLAKRNRINFRTSRWTWIFLLTGLSASGPIVISPKQLGFYLVPSLPFFALMLAVFIQDILSYFVNKMSANATKVFNFVGVILLLGALVFSFLQTDKYDRDKEKIMDIKSVGKIVGEDKIISICSDMRQDYALHAYFALYFNISLDDAGHHEYLLSNLSCENEHESVDTINLKKYLLFKSNVEE